MITDNALTHLQSIEWRGKTIEQAREVALQNIDLWDFPSKVEQHTNTVLRTNNVDAIARLLWNAVLCGMRHKVNGA